MKLLDCTLRDGGYRNNWCFTQEIANHVTDQLYHIGVDYVEIGYRNVSVQVPFTGLTSASSNAYIEALRTAVPDANLAVMCHPQYVAKQDVLDMASLGVKMLRFIYPASKRGPTDALIDVATSKGIIATANFTMCTNYSRKVLLAGIEAAAERASVIYLADSNGNMTPSYLVKLMDQVRGVTSKPIGYHNHNNLGLAVANMVAGVGNGLDFADASIGGMGQATGNTPLEAITTYLSREHKMSFDLLRVMELRQYLGQREPNVAVAPDPQQLAMGVYNIHNRFRPLLEMVATEVGVSFILLSRKLDESALNLTELTEAEVRKVAEGMK